MTILYREDLAYIQAHAYGDLAAAAAPEIVSLLCAAGMAGSRLIDIGCGAGESTRRFVDAGFDVWALEPSPALLAYARAAAPGARFLDPVSAYDAALPAADVVVALGEPLTYHDRGQDADMRLRSFFAKVAAVVRPGGMFLFDLIVEGTPSLDSRGWRSGDDWAILFETAERAGEGWLTRDVQTFRQVGHAYRRASERHEVRVFRSELVAAWLQTAGFATALAPAYGQCRLARRRIAFVARRV